MISDRARAVLAMLLLPVWGLLSFCVHVDAMRRGVSPSFGADPFLVADLAVLAACLPAILDRLRGRSATA